MRRAGAEFGGFGTDVAQLGIGDRPGETHQQATLQGFLAARQERGLERSHADRLAAADDVHGRRGARIRILPAQDSGACRWQRGAAEIGWSERARRCLSADNRWLSHRTEYKKASDHESARLAEPVHPRSHTGRSPRSMLLSPLALANLPPGRGMRCEPVHSRGCDSSTTRSPGRVDQAPA